jgi:hypothetical protein
MRAISFREYRGIMMPPSERFEVLPFEVLPFANLEP